MTNLDGRLKKLEAVARVDEGPMRAALVDYIFAQHPNAQTSFWRVWRTRFGDASERAWAAEQCVGGLDVTADDRAAYQRLVDVFFGGYRPTAEPTVDPAPALELA